MQNNSISLKINSYILNLNKFIRLHPNLISLLEALVIFLIFYIACFSHLDPDFGWHLTSGKYFLAHFIPSHDIYTYTARNFPWIDHEWGSDVIMSLLYRVGGFALVSMFFALIWTTALMLNSWRVRFFILLVGASATLLMVGNRPMAWTALGLAITLKIILKKNPGKLLYLIPLIFLLWANLHGGFILGLVILLYYSIIRKNKTVFLVFLISLFVTFINPYGPRLYVEIFRTLTDVQLHFQTQGMAVANFQLSTWPLIIMWGAGFWIYSKDKLINWFGITPLLLLASLVATRNMPLFAVAATPEVDDYYTKTKTKLSKKKITRAGSNVYMIMTTIFIAFTLFYIAVLAIPTSNREANYPIAAVAYLQSHPKTGNLFNDFDYGGYLIWKLPKYQVYIDGRMPSWRNPQGQKYFDIYENVLNNPSAQKTTFSKYNISYVLLVNSPTYQSFIKNLQTQGWHTILVANGSILLSKSSA